ncbi:chemotaxis protein CheR [Marinomonas mediterranea]|jgi:MCP methyltransferase, CheR-type|uniref:Chemotaxis protein methyltransferase n=1 Tax=Marinomonas mediterranea (strain ATCC 700492 / JCM 21426 / NBRC 103028 / MMB-1) TaxID=717774 RepID=F2JTV7_MARM1|nr:CheR family methyltransferase [Marinomonas mediterranea]ADZ90378.1 MCP methyltransferase, CheR-type [Marinomonas mediterranea MMB-1]WCN12488.1 chemotaxis protein CheR [Marinomonas mediterranea]WCN16560.1 chemotaxis protein CheR [Marinomonas mediterranea MMB-1]
MCSLKREFHYTQEDFHRVRLLLKAISGINLVETKDSMVYSRLASRVRYLKMKKVSDYLAYIERDAEELEHFVNALTTNLTSFFREPHHFEQLTQFVRSGESVNRVWSAASSTGEEPYSIAMSLVRLWDKFDIPARVVASDINSHVLKAASEGAYHLDSVESIEDKQRFFLKGKGRCEGMARVKPELRELVEFRQINLLNDEWPIEEEQDVIFCRNVMIYFEKEQQEALLVRLLTRLRKGGMYIAGHSENFSQFTNLMSPLGNTSYIKR